MSEMTAATGLHEVCGTDDLWDGEMEVYEVGGVEVLLVKAGGAFTAFHPTCPHQDIPLVEGKLEKGVLTCRAHLWQFDAVTGQGVNPSNCRLQRYPVVVQDGVVSVGTTPIAG